MIKKFLKSLLSDESGAISSKRFVGIVASFILFFAMGAFMFMDANAPPDAIIYGIVTIAVGCLGLSSIDKYTSK